MICFELFSFLTYNKYVNLNREVNTMKKIFIILSVLSLFVGCASKPKKFNEDAFQDISIEENLVENFFNQTIINKSDYEPYVYEVYSMDPTYCTKTERTDFTIKIDNTSTETLYLKFQTWHFDENGKCDGCRFFYSIVSPNDTGLFNLFDFITLGEDGLIIYVWDSQNKNYRSIFHTSHYNFKEVIKNHSLELIYDGVRPAPHGIISNYDYRFIEPFECEFNMDYEK